MFHCPQSVLVSLHKSRRIPQIPSFLSAKLIRLSSTLQSGSIIANQSFLELTSCTMQVYVVGTGVLSRSIPNLILIIILMKLIDEKTCQTWYSELENLLECQYFSRDNLLYMW